MDATRLPGHILTFYSYKGGTGRSMALANVAWLLASAGRRVLMIDWDLEAPGLHRYFQPFLIDHELSGSEGLLDLVDRYATEAISPVAEGEAPAADWWLPYTDFADYRISINYPHFPEGGRLDLLTAGRQTDAYAVKVNTFNWQNLYDRLGGGAFFDAFANRARGEYDYILIDSRTGVSDTAGICSVQMPDTLVVCFTYNNQSIKGAEAIARSAIARRHRLNEERRGLALQRPDTLRDSPREYQIFPVPMRVEIAESDRLAVRQQFARGLFAPLAPQFSPAAFREYWGRVEVPYHPFYSYEEVLSPFKDEPADPKTVLAAFLRITRFVTRGEVKDQPLTIAPEVKQQFLKAYAETPGASLAATVESTTVVETAEDALRRTVAMFVHAAGGSPDDARRVVGRLVRVPSELEGGRFAPIRARLDDFPPADAGTINRLSRYALVSLATDQAGQTTVGLAHDMLLAAWPGMVESLEADRPFLAWRQQMRVYLADSESNPADGEALLTGRVLADAEFWLRKRPDELNETERRYIRASRDAADASSSFVPVAPRQARASDDDVEYAREMRHHERDTLRSRWGIALPVTVGALTVAAIAVLSNYWLRQPVLPDNSVKTATILAAAGATTDPLQRLLLLLELDRAATPPARALELGRELLPARVPYAALGATSDPVTISRFSMSGDELLTGNSAGAVFVWRSSQDRVAIETGVGAVTAVAYDSETNRLLAVGENRRAELWQVTPPSRVTIISDVSPLTAGTLLRGMPVLYESIGSSPGLTVHNIQNARATLRKQTIAYFRGKPLDLVFSQSGGWGAAVYPAELLFLNVNGPDFPRVRLPMPASEIRKLAMSSNGGYLAARTDGFVVWSTAGRQVEWTFPAITSDLSQAEAAIGVSPDGLTVAVGLGERVQALTRERGGSLESYENLDLPGQSIRDVDFSPDGTYLVMAAADGRAYLWQRSSQAGLSEPNEWSEFWTRLRGKTSICLAVQDRGRLLAETPEAAAKAHQACDETYGLKRLAARKVLQTGK